MKIDAINFGAFTGTTPVQNTLIEETGTSGIGGLSEADWRHVGSSS